VKIIALVFCGLTTRPLVLTHLYVIFTVCSIKSLRIVRKHPPATMAYHLHSCRCENLVFVDPQTDRLLQGTTVMGIKPLPVDSLCLMYLQWFFSYDRQRFLPASMFSVQSTSSSGISCLIMACLITTFELLSKAPSISKKAPMAYSLDPRCLYNLPTSWCNAVSVDLLSL
jgi:hypothetical protein